jgi:hypothetical protein
VWSRALNLYPLLGSRRHHPPLHTEEAILPRELLEQQ